jgi:hypothetical protein
MNRKTLLAYLLLLAATAAVFGRSVGFGFVRWDDLDLVAQNPLLNPPSWSNFATIWARPVLGLYTPLAYTGWAAVATLGNLLSDHPGPANMPGLFHALNLLLHLANAALVFSILRKCCPKVLPALAGAMFFALHPMQVEAVGWISGMNNLLAGMFSLLAIRLYLEFATPAENGVTTDFQAIEKSVVTPFLHAFLHEKRQFYIATCIALLLALLSKPTAIATPVMIAILGLAIVRVPIRSILRQIAPLFLTAIPFAIIAHFAQPASAVPGTPLWFRPIVAMDAIAFYLGKIFWPFHLTLDYFRTPGQLLATRAFLTTVPIGAMLITFAIFLRRKFAWFSTGMALLIAGILPVLGLVNFDFQIYSTVADRYVYLAMLGPALALSLLLANLENTIIDDRTISNRHAFNRAICAAAFIAIGLLAWRSFDRLSAWRDSDSLAASTLQLDPGSEIGNTIEAGELANIGRASDSIFYYRNALRRDPASGKLHYDLANALLAMQTPDSLAAAVTEYTAAIEIFANSSPPSAPNRPLSNAMSNLGITYHYLGEDDLAETEFKAAIQADLNNPEPQKSLAALNRMRQQTGK